MCAHAHAHALTRARLDMYVTHAYVRMYARPHKDACARTRARAHARMHARPSHKRLQLLARARTNVRHARICTHVRTFTQGRMCALALTMHTHACTRGRVINGFSSWRVPNPRPANKDFIKIITLCGIIKIIALCGFRTRDQRLHRRSTCMLTWQS